VAIIGPRMEKNCSRSRNKVNDMRPQGQATDLEAFAFPAKTRDRLHDIAAFGPPKTKTRSL